MVYNFLDQTVIMGFGMGDLKSKLDLSWCNQLSF
jgi:hypothetical protein